MLGTAPIVAIDFETANERRNSACALGLARVENGRVVARREVLIRPPEMRFSPFTIQIHGIRPEDVADAPEFPEIWQALAPMLEGALLVAHNAAFDMSVLRVMLTHYGLPVPEQPFLCTLLVARRLWPDLPRHKLNVLAAEFDIPLDHHQAGSDAAACATILLRAMREIGADDPAALLDAVGIGFGRLGAEGNLGCRVRSGPLRRTASA